VAVTSIITGGSVVAVDGVSSTWSGTSAGVGYVADAGSEAGASSAETSAIAGGSVVTSVDGVASITTSGTSAGIGYVVNTGSGTAVTSAAGVGYVVNTGSGTGVTSAAGMG